MKNNFFKFLLLSICVLISLTLFGCSKGGKIQFYRENAINQTLNDVKKALPQQTVTKSSGVVIYKDNSNQQNTGNQGVTFCPKDVDFDLPIKIK